MSTGPLSNGSVITSTKDSMKYAREKRDIIKMYEHLPLIRAALMRQTMRAIINRAYPIPAGTPYL